MTKTTNPLLISAALATAAGAAIADIDARDQIIDDTAPGLHGPEHLTGDADSLQHIPEWFLTSEATRFTGAEYLVADQHDGTWVGGGGTDSIVRDPRPRTLRDRLFRGNAAGGFAVAGALAVLAWAIIRRRRG